MGRDNDLEDETKLNENQNTNNNSMCELESKQKLLSDISTIINDINQDNIQQKAP